MWASRLILCFMLDTSIRFSIIADLADKKH